MLIQHVTCVDGQVVDHGKHPETRAGGRLVISAGAIPRARDDEPPRREQAAIPPCTGCGGGQTSSVHLTSNRTKSRSNVTIAAPCFDGQRRDVGVPCGDIQP